MENLESESIREFDIWAKDYDQSKRWQYFFSNKGLLQVVDPLPNTKLLDIGCATGTLLYKVSLLNRKVGLHGIDISPKMINIAKSKLDGLAEIRIGSADKLPYKNNLFDYVTCATSFHHYPNPQKALKEMFRVLKPGGKLFLLDPFTDGIYRKIFCKILDTLFQEHGTHLFKKKKMHQMFSIAGFSNIHQSTYLKYKLITQGQK